MCAGLILVFMAVRYTNNNYDKLSPVVDTRMEDDLTELCKPENLELLRDDVNHFLEMVNYSNEILDNITYQMELFIEEESISMMHHYPADLMTHLDNVKNEIDMTIQQLDWILQER